MATKEFIVAIELGSSKVTGIAGQKNLDGSINVLAVVKEESSSFIRKGVAYNIDKRALCISNIVKKLTNQLKTEITKVYVGVGGQSIRSVRNVITKDLPVDTKVTEQMVIDLMDANNMVKYPDQEILDVAIQEYKIDSQYQSDPVGIQCSRLEGNFLNILQRYTFYKNLNSLSFIEFISFNYIVINSLYKSIKSFMFNIIWNLIFHFVCWSIISS